MGLIKKSGLKEAYPAAADAIAAVVVTTAKAIENLPQTHPELESAQKTGLIAAQEESIKTIRESRAWD